MNQLSFYIQSGFHTKLNCPHKQSGFTLIELVLVLVLIGILGAVAAPRLMVSSQFEERLQADKLVGLLRQAQLRAMNDPEALKTGSQLSRCAKVVITKDAFSLANNCDSGLLNTTIIKQEASQGHFVGAENMSITTSGGTVAGVNPTIVLQFGQLVSGAKFLSEASLLGRPVIGGEQLTDRLEITIGGKKVLIEPEGYIHAP